MSVTVKQYNNNFPSRYVKVEVQSVAVAKNEMENTMKLVIIFYKPPADEHSKECYMEQMIQQSHK